MMKEPRLLNSLQEFYNASQAALAEIEGNRNPRRNESSPKIKEIHFLCKIFGPILGEKNYRDWSNLDFTEGTKRLLASHLSDDAVMDEIAAYRALINRNPREILGHVGFVGPIQFDPGLRTSHLICLGLKALALCLIIAIVLMAVGLATNIGLLVTVSIFSYMGLVIVPVFTIGCFGLGASISDYIKTLMHKDKLNRIAEQHDLVGKANKVIDTLTSIQSNLQTTKLSSSEAGKALATWSTFKVNDPSNKRSQKDNTSPAPQESRHVDTASSLTT